MNERINLRGNDLITAAMNNNGGGTGITARITQICDRYAEIMRRSLPRLSATELEAVQAAMVSRQPTNASAVRGMIWLAVEDALIDGLAEKHEIDGPALVGKLKALTYPEDVALLEVVEAHWTRVERKRRAEQIRQATPTAR